MWKAILLGMKRTCPVLVALLTVLVAMVASAQNEVVGLAQRKHEENNIREAVFRYRIDKWEGKKVSESYFKKDPSFDWLRDKSTDEKGILFSIKNIKWISFHEVEVRGGMYCGALCADAGTYRLEKRGQHWVSP
jgi:hypothetical protein